MRDYGETCRDFDWPVPRRFNFGSDVVDAYAQDADRPALVWCDAAGNEARYGFAEVARLSNRFANLLAARGVERGDRVIVMLPRIPPWQIAMLGCVKLGAIPVPCVTMLSPADLGYRIAHSGARAMVAATADLGKAPPPGEAPAVRVAVGGAVPGWVEYKAAMAEAGEDFAAARLEADEPAIIFYTSGTSGKPKGGVHGARALFVWRYAARYWLDLGAGDLAWCTADTGWSKAGTSVLFGPWSWGATVLFYDGPFDPAARLELLARYRVTVFCASATELRRLVQEDVGRYDLSALRRTVSAGETLNPEVAARWSALTGAPCHEGYGQTESLMSIHTYPCTEARPGSAGLPLPGYRIAVLDAGNSPLGPGEAGTLAIGLPNPNMMLGYWGEPARLGEQIVTNQDGEWFLTGDVAHRDGDGYVTSHGRADDVINAAGYRIGPAEVENALIEHAAVAECAAVASPDAERGEVVKAFVVLAAGHAGSAALVAELQAHCKRATAPYKYPRRIEFVADLPKNVAGKILRARLRRREFGG